MTGQGASKKDGSNDFAVQVGPSKQDSWTVLQFADPAESVAADTAPLQQPADTIDMAGVDNQPWWKAGMPSVRYGFHHGRSAVLPEGVTLANAGMRCARVAETAYCQPSPSSPTYRVTATTIAVVHPAG